ncbi:BGTF surface domain-containing protein [Natronosalvus amylolyticus]|uniref:BGTF surface domain-containing protein n=1 Tax=Natronosalvus amylolyticus TaxID=2961994 RepID=UPI0020C94DC2|nr:BGTF surface domain-containing protein [Natronosalvus amylolyticus]
MTGTKQKISSALMAVLMVLSVVAIGGAAFAGAATAADDSVDKNDLSGVYFAGQTIEVTGITGDAELREGDTESSTWVTNLNVDGDTVTIDTSDLDGDEYVIRDDDGDHGPFEIREQNVGFGFADDTVTIGDDTTLDFESDNRKATVNVTVSAEDLTAEEINATFEDAELVGEDDDVVLIQDVTEGDSLNASFSGYEAGDYEFTVSVEDSTAEDTASITVNDADAYDVNFVEDFQNQEVGDVVEFEIDIEGGDEAYVTLEDEYDFYSANFTVSTTADDGVATVKFNTFAAAQGDADAVFTPGDDTDIVEANEPADLNLDGERIIPGEIEMEVAQDDGSEVLDIAFIQLNERSTDDLTTWTTSLSPSEVADADPADIPDAGIMTDEIAAGDTVVVQVEASGLYGYFDGDFGENGLELEFESTEETVYGSAPSVNASQVDHEVVIDEENNQFFVAVSSADLGQALEDEGERYTFETPAEIDTVFSISDENPYVADDDSESVNQLMTAVAPSLEIVGEFDDEDRLTVEKSDAAVIEGETNVAPGQDVDYRLRFTETIVRGTATIQDDGTFAAEFDLDNREAGDTFTVTPSLDGYGFSAEDVRENAVITEDDSTGPIFDGDVDVDPAEPVEGDDVTVTVDISNSGDAEGTTSAEFVFGGDTLIDEEEITLDAGDSEEFSATVEDAAAGDYDWELWIDGEEALSGTLTVEDVDEGETDDGETDDGETDDGETDDGETDDGEADDGETDDGADDVETDDGADDADETDDTADDDGDDGQPGFGVAVALAALLGAAMLALRRQD